MSLDVFAYYVLPEKPSLPAFDPGDAASVAHVLDYAGTRLPHDEHIRAIGERHGGRFIGCGTMVETGERDHQFRFDDAASAYSCETSLSLAGYQPRSSLR
jgi:hypothetical protein